MMRKGKQGYAGTNPFIFEECLPGYQTIFGVLRRIATALFPVAS